MNNRDAKEVIHEALVMYIDDISEIDSVMLLPDCESPLNNEALGVTFKDGDKFQLIIVRNGDE
jgi:hypothetical protein